MLPAVVVGNHAPNLCGIGARPIRGEAVAETREEGRGEKREGEHQRAWRRKVKRKNVHQGTRKREKVRNGSGRVRPHA